MKYDLTEFSHLCAIENQMVTRNMALQRNRYAMAPGTISPDGVAIVGECGHIFIADGSNRWEQQVTGKLRFTLQGLGQWKKVLDARVEMAEKLGVKLVHFVAPDKQIPLAQFRWTEIPEEALKLRPLLQLLELADGTNWVYPVSAMMKIGHSSELYWRGGSHWCASGCVVATMLILESLLESSSFGVENFSFRKNTCQPDLLFKFPGDTRHEEILQIWRSGRTEREDCPLQTTGTYTGTACTIVNDDAPCSESIVIFGDSFSYVECGLINAMSGFFSRTYFIWSKDILWDYVQACKAGYVIWESAERFLFKIPDR